MHPGDHPRAHHKESDKRFPIMSIESSHKTNPHRKCLKAPNIPQEPSGNLPRKPLQPPQSQHLTHLDTPGQQAHGHRGKTSMQMLLPSPGGPWVRGSPVSFASCQIMSTLPSVQPSALSPQPCYNHSRLARNNSGFHGVVSNLELGHSS